MLQAVAPVRTKPAVPIYPPELAGEDIAAPAWDGEPDVVKSGESGPADDKQPPRPAPVVPDLCALTAAEPEPQAFEPDWFAFDIEAATTKLGAAMSHHRDELRKAEDLHNCLLYTSPSPRDS